jgi:hypothetical protein
MSLEFAKKIFDKQIKNSTGLEKERQKSAKNLFLLSQELSPLDYKILRNINPGEFGTKPMTESKYKIDEHLVFSANPKPEILYYELKIKIIKNYLKQTK